MSDTPFADSDSAPERHGAREWIRTHFISPRTPDDDQILQMTGDLIDQLGVREWKPEGLLWGDYYRTPGQRKGGRTRVDSDIPIIKYKILRIALRMVGNLTPGEWKPLIASSLLYYHGALAKARTMRASVRIALPLTLGSLSFLVAAYFISTLFFNGFLSVLAGLILWIPVLTAALIIGVKVTDRISRESWLEADNKAAGRVGREALLNTLVKIDGLGMNDVERQKRKRWFSERPSITRRIENLRSYGQVVTT